MSNGYGGSGGPGSTIIVLYKIVNSEADQKGALFNAFPLSRSHGATLAAVKQNCSALHSLNRMGPDGYHWRVCVEDKPAPGNSEKSFSWWDIQDENARLPIKEAYQAELAKFFEPRKAELSSTDAAAKAAKGAFKSLGKAVSSAVSGSDVVENTGPLVSVIAFKLLDVFKMNDDFNKKSGGGGRRDSFVSTGAAPRAPNTQRRTTPTHAPPARQPAPAARQQYPTGAPQRRPEAARAAPPARSTPARAQSQQDASLLDFGSGPAAQPQHPRTLHHQHSSPPSFHAQQPRPAPVPPPNETRPQRLKREAQEKQKKANRVWDEIDQRWVEVAPNAGLAAKGTASAPPGANHVAPKKEQGIKLGDTSHVANKSATVRAAVHQRVDEMKKSQEKAVKEIREREAQKKAEDAEEDAVRKVLEPKIKAWSEEHGKKKQLRALLASLHTILWPEANWKPITIADVLDDSKCKKYFHKASRVVHPDKSSKLDASKRFLAKRIFDALSQAKAQMDG